MGKLEKLEELKSKVLEFANLANEINEIWQEHFDGDFLSQNYPFESSFDELAYDIQGWSNSTQEITIPVLVGVREVYEQMYRMNIGSFDEFAIEENIRNETAELLEDSMEYIESQGDPIVYDDND